MKKLYFVRHGESLMNLSGAISGRVETPLTARGLRQSESVGIVIKKQLPPIDLIICSPSQRTYQTAKCIAKAVGYPIKKIRKDQLFLKQSFGPLEGTLAVDFYAQHDYKDFDQIKGVKP